MKIEERTSTGHTLTVDLPARRLRVTGGSLETVATIPRQEIKDLCRGCAARVASWEMVSPSEWRIETHDDLVHRRR